MNKVAFLLMTFCIAFSASSQLDKGAVKFFIDNDNGYFEVVLNDTLYLKKFQTELPVGEYSAKIWSPGYMVHKEKFSIKAGEVFELHAVLERSIDYMDYEKEYKEYRKEFHRSFTVPLSLTLASGIYTGTTMLRMYNYRNATADEVKRYAFSTVPSEIVDIKARIADNNRLFKRNRVFFYSGLTLTSLSAVYTIYTFRKFRRKVSEPTYYKKSPFADKFSFYPSFGGGTFIWRLG